MLMPGRHYNADKYRFGFQGQEKDDEIKGVGNSLNYKFRMHDPRIGRFFAIDPLTAKYPFYSPYQFSGNKVIHMIELEGLEEKKTEDKENNDENDEENQSGVTLSMIKSTESLPKSVIRITNGKIDPSPAKLGLTPRGNANITPAQHALGYTKSSPYISASMLKNGAKNFKGTRIWIDLEKAITLGSEFIDEAELLKSIDELLASNPELEVRINKWKSIQPTMEREVLFKGKIDPRAVDNALMRNMRYVGVGFKIVGGVMTAYDIYEATDASITNNSVKPLLAEGIRQIGGWGGAIAGAKYGAMGGAAVGIETGPGAIITGVVGGIVGGVAGYYGADWIGDMIYEND